MHGRLFAAVLTLVLSLSQQRTVCAQTEKFELGGQVTFVDWNAFGTKETGFGGRLSYNLGNYLALETEGNFFPKVGYDRSKAIEGLLGVKVGVRPDRFGLFGKLRPGLIHFTRIPTGSEPAPSPSNPTQTRAVYSQMTEFLLDFGSVVEIYPTHRSLIRFDSGDTVLMNFRFPTAIPDFRTHNLQISAGMSFRF